jgi:hypothetical protein
MWQWGQCSGPASKLLRHNGQVMAGTPQGNRSGPPRSRSPTHAASGILSKSLPNRQRGEGFQLDLRCHGFGASSCVMGTQGLRPGDELQCPHCRRWHTLTLTRSTVTSTPYADDMLFFECRHGRYYAGQVGGSSRFETRRPQSRR